MQLRNPLQKPLHPGVAAAERFAETPTIRMIAIVSVYFWMVVTAAVFGLLGWWGAHFFGIMPHLLWIVVAVLVVVGIRVGGQFGTSVCVRIINNLLSE